MSEECKGCFDPNCDGKKSAKQGALTQEQAEYILDLINRFTKNSFARGKFDVVFDLYRTGNAGAVDDLYGNNDVRAMFEDVHRLADEYKDLQQEAKKLVDNYGVFMV